MLLVFLALPPPNLAIFDPPLSCLVSEQHQRKPSILLCTCFRKPMLYFLTTTAPQIHMCACVWLLHVAYTIPPGSLLSHGAGAPMRSRGLTSARVFPYACAPWAEKNPFPVWIPAVFVNISKKRSQGGECSSHMRAHLKRLARARRCKCRQTQIMDRCMNALYLLILENTFQFFVGTMKGLTAKSV